MNNTIDKFVEENYEEYAHLSESLKKVAILKNRDIIAETISEFNRKGNYIRIFPAKNSNMYD